MKKFMALACAMVLAVAALAACGETTTVEEPTNVATEVETEVETVEATEVATIVE